MKRIWLLFVVVALVDGYGKHNPKFPKSSEESNKIRNVVCSTHESLRNEFIEKSRCGEPKEVFVDLKPATSFEQVSPSSVWVKRCVGLCELEEPGSRCVPTKTRIEQVPVRILNVKTDKETCSMYSVEVHESCGCCALHANDCAPPRVLNPRKCSCQCPNLEERRNCLKKRNHNMKWNRYKCVCQEKKTGIW